MKKLAPRELTMSALLKKCLVRKSSIDQDFLIIIFKIKLEQLAYFKQRQISVSMLCKCGKSYHEKLYTKYGTYNKVRSKSYRKLNEKKILKQLSKNF